MPIPWRWIPVGDDCCSCECCTHCTGTAPACLTVEFSSFADGTLTYDCAALNTEFDVECIGMVDSYTLLDGTELTNACRWDAGLCGTCEPHVGLMQEVRVLFDGTDLYVELLHCKHEAAYPTGYLFKAESVSADCAGWSSVALAYVGEYGEGGDGEGYWTCDGSGASATVTAKAGTCTPKEDCTCQATCDECIGLCDWTTPCCIELTLSDFTTIDSCDATGLNGAHKLAGPFAATDDERLQDLLGTVDYACKWIKCLDPAVCDYDRLGVFYAMYESDEWWYFVKTIRLWKSTGGLPDYIEWWSLFDVEKAVGPFPDCWEELTLTGSLMDDSSGVGSEEALALPLEDECDCETGCARSCETICANELPEAFSVAISGVVNGDCTGCSNINGTYLLARAGSSCCYYYTFSPAVDLCPGAWNGGDTVYYLSLGLNAINPTTLRIRVELQTFASPSPCGISDVPLPIQLAFYADLEAPTPCDEISGESLAATAFMLANTYCDFSGATCTVTAV